MDTGSHGARLSIVVLLVAGIAAGPSGARAAAVGAQLGIDRAGIDGDTPPNTEYTDKVGVIAGVQGEIGIAEGLSLSLQPSFIQKKVGLLVAPSSRGGSTTESELSFDYVSVPLLLKFA